MSGEASLWCVLGLAAFLAMGALHIWLLEEILLELKKRRGDPTEATKS